MLPPEWSGHGHGFGSRLRIQVTIMTIHGYGQTCGCVRVCTYNIYLYIYSPSISIIIISISISISLSLSLYIYVYDFLDTDTSSIVRMKNRFALSRDFHWQQVFISQRLCSDMVPISLTLVQQLQSYIGNKRPSGADMGRPWWILPCCSVHA